MITDKFIKVPELQWKGSRPNCFCGIIPLPNGFRKNGLWAKGASDTLVGIQSSVNPNELRRESLSKPVGLRNLGSTCYVNSVLQFLFSVTAFRNAVFSASPKVVPDDPVMNTLRQVFVAMKVGPTDPVDPGRLVEALQLDHAVQQDGQEFMKLFLSLLEQRFSAVDSSPFTKTIPDLFRGRAGYVTVCQTCREPSASSSRHDNFYELDVPVRGYSSLQDSLRSLLSPELLCGDNQYFCEHCQSKQNATRQLKITLLPPLLCVSLQRFVFDMTVRYMYKINPPWPPVLNLFRCLCFSTSLSIL